MRKYVPALSKELSFPSSHLLGRANLNPVGGGPDGVADLKVVVEKAARAVRGDVLGWMLLRMLEDEGRTRTSAVNGRDEAIVECEVWVALLQ